jgi:mono/diheme cytochrome c family protein
MHAGLLRQLLSVLFFASTCLSVTPTTAAELVVDLGLKRTLTTEELLARPDVAMIQVAADATYQRMMTYRAVPLRALLGVDQIPPDQDLQVTGTDGFVTTLPAGLISDTSGKGAAPWLAIETPNDPWPLTANGLVTGPFYLVWLDPAASNVRSEQWPFRVATIRTVPAWATKWPQLSVDDDVPTGSPIRTGQVLFATQCMVCHPMSGAGDATVGPDLNVPRSPTEYFQPWAMRAFIRNPGSIRAWPEMKMPGFGEASLSDSDLDAIIAYLGYTAARRR